MCTRFLVSSEGEPGKGMMGVGRSMDWYQNTDTVLALRPRGATRESAPGDPGSFTWTSEYGSVVCLMYGSITVDGMNEKGFQVSALYLSESDYGPRDDSRPGLELALVVQCLLDRFATVDEAVEWFTSSNTQIIPMKIGDKPGTGHLALADPSGNSAIIEMLDGETVVHKGAQYTVMANSPVYDEQLVSLSKYKGLGGDEPLPGGTDSPDRFARAAYYSKSLPHTDDEMEFAAEVFSVIRNASTPFGVADPARPYISTTRWRIFADLTNLNYAFEDTVRPNVVWTNFGNLNFEPGPELRVDPARKPALSGDISEYFAPVA